MTQCDFEPLATSRLLNVALASALPQALQQTTRQTPYASFQLQLQQSRLQVRSVQTGAGLQGVQAHRVEAHHGQQAFGVSRRKIVRSVGRRCAR